jgi:drug/metabolite transporter (DMT)-like permease
VVPFILILGVASASCAAILVRLCDAPPLVIAAYRTGISACLVLPLAILKYRNSISATTPRERIAVLLGGISLGVHFAFWITSLFHTSVASAVFLVSTNPIFVALGAWIVLKERMGLAQAAGTAVALAGAGAVAYNDLGSGEHGPFGDLLALAGAAAMSAYLLIGRAQRPKLGLVTYLTGVYSTAAALLVLLTWAEGHPFTGYSGQTYLLFLLLALIPQLLGHGSLNYVLRRVSPSIVALALLAEPIGSTVLAYVVLDETPTFPLMAGFAVILAGIGLATRTGTGSDPHA